jgi:hypothetical protein
MSKLTTTGPVQVAITWGATASREPAILNSHAASWRSFLSRYTTGLGVLGYVFLGGAACNAAQLVTDEATNLKVLRLIFPGMRTSVVSKRKSEKPWPVTDPLGRVIALVKDGLERGKDFTVVGPVSKEEEGPASDLRDYQHRSDQRYVRMEVFRWSSSTGEPFLVAVLNYTFRNANPPRCCRALGRIVLLSNDAGRVLDSFDKVPYAFTMFTSLQFLNVNISGSEKLMIGADFSGAGTVGINSAVFEVSHEKLNPVLSVTTMVLSEADVEDSDIHTLTLDEQRTLLTNGKEFFFVKKTYASGKQVFQTPRIETISFPVATGIPVDWP